MERIICQHYGLCGGCSLMHLDYNEQLFLKQRNIEDYLKHFDIEKINKIFPSKDITFFRNKMEYVFGKNQSGEVIIGMRRSGKFWSIVDIKKCLVMSEKSNEILNYVKEWANSTNLLPYDLKKHNGFLRYLTIREAKNTNQILLYLVTTPTTDDKTISEIENLAKQLKEKYSEIKTFIWAVSSRKADAAVGESMRVIFGDGYIYENLNNFKFRISPNTFFQTNPKTAEHLYSYISSLFTNRETTVLDLYCGCGPISLFISNSCEKIIGVDSHKPSIDDAIYNANLNNVRNCEFIHSTVEEFTKKILLSKFHLKLSTVILDPPRAGLYKKLINSIIRLNPNRIIYVSCNLKALVSDLVLLLRFYKIKSIQPLDLFPHTEHIEIVADLEHR